MGCSSTKYIEYKSQDFTAGEGIRIETKPKNVHVHCPPKNIEHDMAVTSIIVNYKDRLDSFLFRRAWPHQSCLLYKKDIERILENGRKIEVFGIEKFRSQKPATMDPDENGWIIENLDEKTEHIWTFHKIQNEKGDCESYFEGYCEKP